MHEVMKLWLGAAYIAASLAFAYFARGDILSWARVNWAVIGCISIVITPRVLALGPRLPRWLQSVLAWTVIWMIVGTAVAWSAPNSDGDWGWVPIFSFLAGGLTGAVAPKNDPVTRKGIDS
ncbi:hypothetical protein [Phenylobacterium sp.]|uniref:hypothetical protein n=1 Tax=Phenylobacterium sp. TaxID=1871053 RepID=UPI002737BE10|nr:hypothetical protein [Phenylobacterium sp.]MDP3867032.1 hypothetical protein [Phenylobacterium sp.]